MAANITTPIIVVGTSEVTDPSLFVSPEIR